MKKSKIIFGMSILGMVMAFICGCATTTSTPERVRLQQKLNDLQTKLETLGLEAKIAVMEKEIDKEIEMIQVSAVTKKVVPAKKVAPTKKVTTESQDTLAQEEPQKATSMAVAAAKPTIVKAASLPVVTLQTATAQTAPTKWFPKEPGILECALLSDLKEGQLCKVSTGKCFKIIAHDLFAIGVQEMSDPKNPNSQDCKHPGMIWSRLLRKTDVNFELAQVACPHGTRLPTKKDFARLRDSMDTILNTESIKYLDPKSNHNQVTEVGKKDLYHLFPDLKDHWFWLASSVDAFKGFGFSGNDGGVDDNYRSDSTAAARCVQDVHGTQIARYDEQ